jgi:anti-sigma factor RsiW
VSCQELVELVTAYLEGSLPEDDVRAFDEHLALCPGCERYLEQVRSTIEVLGELPQESLSGSAREQLLGAFAAWRSTPGGSSS